METLSVDSSRSTRSLVDHVFDLDLALTMVDNSSSELAPATVESSGGHGCKVTGSLESPNQEKSSSEPEMVDAKSLVGVCTVCMEAFQPDTAGKQVPICGHVYHGTCIAKWLSLHNSCPLCRCKISGHQKSSALSV